MASDEATRQAGLRARVYGSYAGSVARTTVPPSSGRPGTDGVILTHTVLVALTPLIPLPFVDKAVKGYLMRGMFKRLATAHKLRLWDREVATLADDEVGRVLGGYAKGVVLMPLKLILRKTFLVLAGKSIVDLASRTYHRGWLLDHAFEQGWCAPAGPRSATQVRTAIDELLREVPIARSPVTRAFRLGFDRSRDLLGGAVQNLRDKLATLRGRPVEADVKQALDDVTDDGGGLAAIVAQLRRAMTEVPEAHFDELAAKLAAKLAPKGDYVQTDPPGPSSS